VKTNVEELIVDLKRCLVGPDHSPEIRGSASQIELGKDVVTLPKSGPYVDEHGNEVLSRERPSRMYGVGVLFAPSSVELFETSEASENEVDESAEEVDLDASRKSEELIQASAEECDEDPDEPRIRPQASKSLKPSSMGISFLCKPKPGDELVIEAAGARYAYHEYPPERIRVAEGEVERTSVLRLYQRIPEAWVKRVAVLDASGLGRSIPSSTEGSLKRELSANRTLQLDLDVVVRPYNKEERLITVTLVNRSTGSRQSQDDLHFFQSQFVCRFENDGKEVSRIQPYPAVQYAIRRDEDDLMDLLYREREQFATGHGCSADWDEAQGGQTRSVCATCFPVYWADLLSPDVRDHRPMMRTLSGDDWKEPLVRLISSYRTHVDKLNPEAVPERLRSAAKRNIAGCRSAIQRMEAGVELLSKSDSALTAFKNANKAMRLQQIASQKRFTPLREVIGLNAESNHFAFQGACVDPEVRTLMEEEEPSWRAFQLAMILSNLEGLVNPQSADRSIVDLIWFPTGGGKTEAYLGLIAFLLCFEAGECKKSLRGVRVLMRYTLRLLTAQQFERSASLICALNVVLKTTASNEIKLGIFVGGTTTPNKLESARDIYRKMTEGVTTQSTLFVHSKCPWCGAEAGRAWELTSSNPNRRARSSRARRGNPRKVSGIVQDARLSFTCSDTGCRYFNRALPFHVVDEVLLSGENELPNLLIATVDKFAQLPKNPQLRRLFGIGDDGNQDREPPALIIQDELHLISESLGSVVGAFEPVIHFLCERGGSKPKIVCSTATIRTYRGQVKSLFARDQVAVFPPPELSISDSFFVHVPRDPVTGSRLSRRAYLGVFGSGYPSFQSAEARVLAAMLQAPMQLDVSKRDPYWTLLSYFNSLRELGTTITMLESSVWREARTISGHRNDLPARRPSARIELTSRVSSMELAKAFKRLEIEYSMKDDLKQEGAERPLDVCLATSIVEVGIDVPRLSMMCVVGQPKKVSTYIQATGRVGRSHPGLIVCLYDHTRKRDRSVFESFRTFHERMYAMVEPTTLTPFSCPVQERTIPALVASIARLAGDRSNLGTDPRKISVNTLELLRQAVHDRKTDCARFEAESSDLCRFVSYLAEWVSVADCVELERLKASLAQRFDQWSRWQRSRWHRWSFQFDPDGDESLPQMLDFDPFLQSKIETRRMGNCWWVPNSMRDVDGEAQLWFNDDSERVAISDDELFPYQTSDKESST
jgi:hypothetical protein